ncbi:MAG: hypothetical protein IJV00_10480 [Clostridia bacterium]|nr:hypothetical protein [Clostridia bacterium]
MKENKIRIAYLPLYIKLYDDSNPNSRGPLVEYMKKLVGMIEERGFEVVLPDCVCRVKEEFDRAAEKFNADPDVTAVVTQHLAYSPSLESISALASLKAPIVVFDTTPDRALIALAKEKNLIMPNHGIHGVQDMCNMLIRAGKDFEICAGHADDGIVDRLCSVLRGAYAAKTMKNCRVGMIGGEFEGMGDFRVPDDELERLTGVKTVRMTKEEGSSLSAAVTDAEIEEEIASDAENFKVRITNRANYAASVRAGLAVRKWIDENSLDGVTVNFLHVDSSGLPKMPFAECCKTLGRGLGYAGEGDNLTAALVASLIRAFPDTTFTEMFCPDWERATLLMSHMGELNPRLTSWKPSLDDKPFNYNSTGDTVGVNGCYRAGKAVLVNLAPRNGSFALILTEVTMTDDGERDGVYSKSVQGWMKPNKPLADFLEEYSRAGGTHHSALVYGGDIKALAAFGRMMGFEIIII